MLVDYHIHTDYSKDAVGKIQDVCESAIKKGLNEICFTNHFEWRCVVDKTYKYAIKDLSVYQKEIEKARKEFPSLTIRFGLELGYFEQYIQKIKQLTKEHDFDYIIGSVHFFGGLNVDKHTGDLKKIYTDYFTTVKLAIKSGYFDCLGHFDYIKRFQKPVSFKFLKPLILDCISEIKKSGRGFELNTSGWRHGLNEPFPSKRILEMIKKAGIERITLGSDSHNPKDVGSDIKKGLKLLKEVGFEKFCTFEKRKPIYHEIK